MLPNRRLTTALTAREQVDIAKRNQGNQDVRYLLDKVAAQQVAINTLIVKNTKLQRLLDKERVDHKRHARKAKMEVVAATKRAKDAQRIKPTTSTGDDT